MRLAIPLDRLVVRCVVVNLAKTPLKAAQAPLATAKNIHCDRRLQLLGIGIVEADSLFKVEGGNGSGDEEDAAAAVWRLRTMVTGQFGSFSLVMRSERPLVMMIKGLGRLVRGWQVGRKKK
jgi:hypothetical protein